MYIRLLHINAPPPLPSSNFMNVVKGLYPPYIPLKVHVLKLEIKKVRLMDYTKRQYTDIISIILIRRGVNKKMRPKTGF